MYIHLAQSLHVTKQTLKPRKMKLTKEHKKALIHDLNDTIDKIDLQKRCMNSKENKLESGEENPVIAWHEIELFLLEEKKRIIEQSLVEDEIDF